MKTVELNISERVFALGYLDNFKGTVSLLAKVLEDVKKFGVKQEDWEKADRKIIKTGDSESWTWNDEKGGLKSIEADEDTLTFLKVEIVKKERAEGFGLKDKAVISLLGKLETVLK